MALRWWLGLLLVLLAGPGYTAISLTPIADIQLPVWNPGAGDLNGSSIFCVRAVQGNTSNPRSYRVRLSQFGSGIFELVNTADASQRIPARIYFEDHEAPSPPEQLSPSTWSSAMQGVSSCNPFQGNAEISIEMDAVDLSQVTAGDYRATYFFLANGSGWTLDFFNIQVTIAEATWIQRLDPIGLSYVRGSDATGNEPFCVWSSTGAYDITISSQTATGSTTFVATGQAVPANTVDYSVLFDSDPDASDGISVTEGAILINQPTSASGSPPSCMVDNAAIRVNFTEAANLDTAPADTYQDELTLFIEPR